MNKEKIEETIKTSELLKRISKERVFYLQIYEKNLLISENCDCWYSVELTKKEVAELAKIFKKISKNMN